MLATHGFPCEAKDESLTTPEGNTRSSREQLVSYACRTFPKDTVSGGADDAKVGLSTRSGASAVAGRSDGNGRRTRRGVSAVAGRIAWSPSSCDTVEGLGEERANCDDMSMDDDWDGCCGGEGAGTGPLVTSSSGEAETSKKVPRAVDEAADERVGRS